MSQKLRDIQGDNVVMRAYVAGHATAGTADEFTIGEAPFGFEVTAVRWYANAGVTGANTNYFTVTVRNRGTDGSGSTVVASKDFVSGTNATAFDLTTITLSATAANLLVTEGQVLTVEKLVTGTGLAMPDGLVEVIGRSRG
jgi:hypothetical protein